MDELDDIKKRLSAIEARLKQLPVCPKDIEIRVGGNEAEIFREGLKAFRKATDDKREDNKA